MENIKRFILYILMFLSIGWLLPIRSYALETADIYGDVYNGVLSYKNHLNYKTSNGGLYTTTLGTVVSEANYGFSFYIDKSAQVGKVYKIRLNFNDYDYLHTNTYEVVRIPSCTIIGYELKNIGSNTQAKSVDIMIQCIEPRSNIQFNIGLNNQRITTINWRLNSVQWEQLDENADIIVNNTQNTQNIINNQDQNTQDIIDNQNAIAEEQEENQKVCLTKEIKNGEGFGYEDGYLKSDGTIFDTNVYHYTSDYIMIESQSQYTITLNYTANSPSYCLYDKDKNLIACNNYGNNQNIYLNSASAYYIRYSYRNNSSDSTILKGKICQNGNQAIGSELNDLQNFFSDSSAVSLNQLGDTAGWLPAGPIDSIINLPATMITNLTSSLNGLCQALHLPIPFLNNKHLDIPCISTIFGKINGLTIFWEWVGTIASVIIFYSYFINLYNYYDRLTTLQANYLDDFGGAP